MMATPAQIDLQTYLTRFGLESFRPGQQEVIQAVLDGEDCLCIMPTGGGKSLCYQLPAIAREGVTLVVSPLISLMKDQVDSLRQRDLRATFINSTLNAGEQAARIEQMRSGALDLVYIAPERLRNARFAAAIRGTQVQLLAVDEAHCISEWGHDFRPDYARLGQFRERLGSPQTIALTATATPTVREDVSKLLQLRTPKTYITGFARPNLRFEVLHPSSSVEKNDLLVEIIKSTPGPGLVYAATRKRCEELGPMLRDRTGDAVGLYHGGMPLDQRRMMQEALMRDELRIMVATNAFGMGIDKRDLRFVVHYNMPGSLEAYYQEAGRAGRDGQPARCVLLFSHNDRYIQEFFIDNGYPSRQDVASVYEYLRRLEEDPIELTQQELKQRLESTLAGEGVGACEQLLEKCGALVRVDSQHNLAHVCLASDLPTLVDLLPKEAKVQRKLLRALEVEVGDRRHEWVMFQPQKVMAFAGLEKEAMNRALREMRKLEPFDYIPPFRGKAIHVVNRERPFAQLEIDFDELERRKAAELEKLERVVRYARTGSCRQFEILEYFGDPHRRRCGCCDNCGGPASPGVGQGPAHISGPLASAVCMALSGVARSKGRFGRQVIVQMLCGSQSSKIRKWKLDQLSTFGLLAELTQLEANELFDAMFAASMLEQEIVDRYRPTVNLTEYGGDVMRGKAPMRLDLPKDLAAKLERIGRRPSRRTDARPENGELQRRPAPSNSPSDPPLDRPIVSRPDVPASAPSHLWTWWLLNSGISLQQCVEIRRLPADELIEHVLQAGEAGHVIQAEWLLTPQQIQRLSDIILHQDVHDARAVVNACEGQIGEQLVRIYLKSRQSPADDRQL